jgi:hypothetical protein
MDLHEGDWEHVDVIVDKQTGAPRHVLMARHDDEDELYDWDSPKIERRGSHIVVYVGFGGHASYSSCGIQQRASQKPLLGRILRLAHMFDYTVCPHPLLKAAPLGPVFTLGSTTPLVELRKDSWACWPGLFGERAIKHSAWKLDALRRRANGPFAPLRQKENAGVCADRGPASTAR